MRLGVNCLALDPGYVGGVTTYALGLLDGLAALAPRPEVQLFATSRNADLLARFRDVPGFSLRELAVASPARRLLPKMAEYTSAPAFYRRVTDLSFRHWAAAMGRDCDVLYTPTSVLRPFDCGRPQLLSMHDVQHLHFPQFFSPPELRRRRVAYAASAAAATWLQASSGFIKQDLLAQFPELTADRIVTIPEGVAIEAFRAPGAAARVRRRHGLPERFLFYPAQLWPHKNHVTVLEALRFLRDQHGRELPLVLTGAPYAAAPDVMGYVERHRMGFVHYLGAVPFDDLVGLYQSCWFTITAVLYESSSLCLLEAAAAGSPLIASRTPPNEELGRRLEVNLFDPLDIAGLAALLLRLWDDHVLRERQRIANSQGVSQFAWAKIAARYVEFLDGAMRERVA